MANQRNLVATQWDSDHQAETPAAAICAPLAPSSVPSGRINPMAKRLPPSVRKAVVAQRAMGIMPTEIVRRLAEDEAGLGFAVEISKRTVVQYLTDHRLKHGEFPTVDPRAIDRESIDAQKALAFSLVAQELGVLKKRRKGSLKRDDVRKIEQCYRALTTMESLDEHAAMKRRHPSKARHAGAPDPPQKESTILEKLAEEMAAEQESETEAGEADRGGSNDVGSPGAAAQETGQVQTATTTPQPPTDQRETGDQGMTEADPVGNRTDRKRGVGPSRPRARVIPISQRRSVAG